MKADALRKTLSTVALTLAMVFVMPLSGPAAAQSATFAPPEGCTAFLTVQSRSCTVSHYWTCEGDAPGIRWRIVMDDEGPFYLAMTDYEFRWLLGYDLRSGGTSTLLQPEDDPASMTELLANGRDSMAYSIMREDGAGRSARRDYTGFDALTGESVIVDGRVLDRTSFSYEYPSGNGRLRVTGNQFVSRDWRLFFGGVETTETPDGGTFESDGSPMDFAEPGERGFLSTTPIYDCGNIMSGLTPPLESERG